MKQIDANNVHNLQVAWTISTVTLRGHEGSPLVIADTLYMHTPFPNNVYAINACGLPGARGPMRICWSIR